jgi:hypothetical protein
LNFFEDVPRTALIFNINNLSFLQDGWLDADQLGCFKFLESSVNLFWVEAQQKCESIGGYLAEPSNARYCKNLQKA